jgi:acyl-coenzyme A thioesterase PaaI-like protein
MMGGDGLEGYSGCLHSGVIAALLDGAMTNCLFAHGCRAFTAELTVRYRQAVAAQDRVTVRAWLTRSRPPLRLLRAELRQGACVKATAVGKFIESYE